MADNADRESDIKPTLRKIVKDLTQRCVKEIVKEATKQAARSKTEKDIQKLQEAAKKLSDREREDFFKGTADEVSQRIYEGKTKDEDLVRAISDIIQKDLVLPEIIGKSKAGISKPQSKLKKIFSIAVKFYFMVFVVMVVIGAYLFLSNPEPQTMTTVDGDWTEAMGTGDVQVTLTWYANADIDLYVEDPYGETVSYKNSHVSSGGELDLDNQCDNFVMGKPENIYWSYDKAPTGTYRVSVNYFADCGTYRSPTGPVDWTVTTKVNGNVNTFRETLGNVGDTQEVTTFQF